MSYYDDAVKITDATYTNKTPAGFKKNKELSSRIGKVYENETTGDVWVGYRGTDPKRIADLYSDAFILTGLDKQSPRYRNSRELLNKTKVRFPERNIYVTGHSLAGNVTKNLARNESGIKEAYSFSTGSNPYFTMRGDGLYDKIGLSRKKTNTPINEYSTGSDPISLDIWSGYEKDTTKKIVPRKPGLDPHSFQNFL